MIVRKAVGAAVALGVCLLLAPGLRAQWSLDIESGLVSSGYNNVRIPGDTGTLFSLSRDLRTGSAPYIRARLTWQLKPRHAISLFAGPLSLKASGAVDQDILFNGEAFAAGTPLQARYRFNSYRLTYRYTLVRRPRFLLGIGFTAKIRDAGIRVEGGGTSSEKTNVGFVPLLNLRLEWAFSDRVRLLLDGDGLAAPQGRAEDVFLGILWRASPRLSLKAGYRVVEGGADNDEVYNFALIHFLAAGVIVSF